MKNLLSVLLFVSFFSATMAFGQDISLETKPLLEGRITLKVPSGFKPMKEEMLRLKYPLESRPTMVFTNEAGSINVALNHTRHKADQEMIMAYKDNLVQTFRNVYPAAEWKDSGLTEINGRKTGFLELVTPAVDTDIYNLLFFTDLEDRLLICTFNCTLEKMKDWVPVGKEIMNSLIVK